MGRWFWQWVETRTIGRAVLSCIDLTQTKRAAPTGPPFFIWYCVDLEVYANAGTELTAKDAVAALHCVIQMRAIC
jgi:hypothetical protein